MGGQPAPVIAAPSWWFFTVAGANTPALRIVEAIRHGNADVCHGSLLLAPKLLRGNT
jgi:hypothetical protein